MTPLEEYLTDRPLLTSRWSGLQAAAGIVPSLARWMDRRIWPESLRHMRSFARGIIFHREKDGTWIMLKNGVPFKAASPLRDMVGALDRPVTIVASGPSSRDADWERIARENRFIIAVNGGTSVVAAHSLQPDLHVVMDRHFALSGPAHFRNFPEVPLVATHRAASVVAATTPGIFDHKPLSILERVNAWHGLPVIELARVKELNRKSGHPFHFPDFEDTKCTIGWSNDPALGVFSGTTVVVSALQVAVSLGAADIEIIGMDLRGQARAYEEGAAIRPSYLEKQYASYILPTFEVMHRALLGSGVKVKNLSPVCPLPARLFDL